MKRIVIIILSALVITACKDQGTARIYLSNHSLAEFDKSEFKVFVDDQLILNDSVKNRYLSFHWKDSTIQVPKSEFNMRVVVSSNNLNVEKDTTVLYRDSLQIFVTFNFSPRFKRYRNPEIYKHLPAETSRFKEISDSLYANNLLSNASEYLNDTIPTPRNIEIDIK
jgi:hypothetical protein